MPDCLADIPLGGPDGELSASMRYLAQRYTMPYRECMATLTDIGTEESVPARWKLDFPLRNQGFSDAAVTLAVRADRSSVRNYPDVPSGRSQILCIRCDQ